MRRNLMRTVGGVALVSAAASVSVASVAGAAQTPHATAHRTFTETEAGTLLSTSGSLRSEDVFRVKTSPFGGGTTIRDITLTGRAFPASAKATAVAYYKDGRLGANETLTYGAPDTAGVGGISGTGTCVSGTFKHENETCTYTVKGSYDLTTGRIFLTLSGTYTPAQSTGKKSG